MASEQDNKSWAVFSGKCCNPFGDKHPTTVKSSRHVSERMCSLNLGIQMGMKICDKCRKKLYDCRRNDPIEHVDILPGPSAREDTFVDPNASIDFLNKSLELIGESPIKKKKVQVGSYTKNKIEKIKTTLEKHLMTTKHDSDVEQDDVVPPESEMLAQLKGKFSQTTKRSEQMTILTLLPKSWTVKKIEEEFGVSNYMARSVKRLVKEKGILSTPNPKPGKTLNEATASLVVEFYNSDDVSRMMPGKKDFVTIREKGSKRQIQKRLVLNNISELYQLFKEKYPAYHIGFSKFCQLRPKNCILAGGSGTHTVCVCTIHQNVKLMMNSVGFSSIMWNGDVTALKSYYCCLAKIMCNPASFKCYTDECKQCPGVEKLSDALINQFKEDFVDEVTYKQWITVDRCTMESITKNVEDFVEDFLEKLVKLKTHSFIANMQKELFLDKKENLSLGEVVINCDFAENYSFVIQDEVQSFHWTSTQATIHPFIIYYKWENKLKHLQYIFISDCLEHNTTAFYVFQDKLISIMKENLPFEVKKITYFSDGSSAQYKNKKNFHNLCFHEADFGIEAEWQFFATSHGKSACDGLGGTIKRLAAKASLQRPYKNQILTPRQLFEFAVDNIAGIDFEYCSLKDYEDTEKKLASRFRDSVTIIGTQKFHSYIPMSENRLFVKYYQHSPEHFTKIITEFDYITPSDLQKIESGFVTIAYDQSWWLACILKTNKETCEFEVSFLHPKGPAASFYYPKPIDILTVPGKTLLQKVEPATTTGRVYVLTKEENVLSLKALEKYLKKD